MTHYFSAYKTPTKGMGMPKILVGWLSRQESNSLLHKKMYEALESKVFRNNLSYYYYNKEQLEKALNFLCKKNTRKVLTEKRLKMVLCYNKDMLQKEIAFINVCLQNLDDKGEIIIKFGDVD